MKKLYVLAGKARTGKDSAANIIEAYYTKKNYKVIRYSCTVYLKEYIKKLYSWDGMEQTKPRDILQRMGNEIRDKYPNYFINRMEEDIRFLQNHADIIIVTGVRLTKELEILNKIDNNILIKMEKENNDLTEKQKQDITEIDVDNYKNFDYIIYNDDYNNLENKIIKLIEEVEHEY